LAEQALSRQGSSPFEDFHFCLLIDPNSENATHVGIVDYRKPICYLHEWRKACHFGFGTLVKLADEVLRVKRTLVRKVNGSVAGKHEIFIRLEGGLVQEVVGAPPGIEVSVLDYDVEGEDEDRLEINPLDGELCCVTNF